MTSAVRVSMLDLLRTGNFAELPFGLTREGFLEKLGETEWVAFSSRRERSPSLLRYGNVEFFITPDSHLFYGFLWEPMGEDVPQGNESLQIDPWILRAGVSRAAVEQHLHNENIAFTASERPAGVYSLLLESSVRLNFRMDDNGADANTLSSVEALRPEILPYQKPEKQIFLTLTTNEVDQIRQQAAQQGISMAKLCAAWIRQHLATASDTVEH